MSCGGPLEATGHTSTAQQESDSPHLPLFGRRKPAPALGTASELKRHYDFGASCWSTVTLACFLICSSCSAMSAKASGPVIAP